MAWSINLPRTGTFALRRDLATVAHVREQAEGLQRLTDSQLEERAAELRHSVQGDLAPGIRQLISPAFSLMSEAIRRALGFTLFDVQLQAGMAMAGGAVAEMHTGEGKTLAASLPAYLFSLFGQGVHIATPNAYLAQRDGQSLAPAFALLGCSTGVLPEGGEVETKRQAYACDITYATGYDLGFDYLRDRLQDVALANLALGRRQQLLLRGEALRPPRLQRGQAFAIIDEIDSVLIDEACTPLILAEATQELADDVQAYAIARRLASQLVEGRDFEIDLRGRQVVLSQSAIDRLPHEKSTLLRPWADYLRQALFAEHLLVRDIDYVVADGRVLLVDEFTGRIHPDRSWQEGLHQAVEAKEGISLRGPQRTLARITRQRYFRQYRMICGMTGTAMTAKREFWRQYRLPIVPVPLLRTSRRIEIPDRYFITAEAKREAIVQDVQARYSAGQPVLIGSRTIENSLLLAQQLTAAGVPFCLLNGRQDEAEASIVARAGQRGMVTVATNMAGRGTDIRLGHGVVELGGLHVIGAERHESQRIDRQLIGRAARQGDPGSWQFFVSAEDTLLRRFAPNLTRRMTGLPSDGGELRCDLARRVRTAQRRAESEACHARRRLVLYDDWLLGACGSA